MIVITEIHFLIITWGDPANFCSSDNKEPAGSPNVILRQVAKWATVAHLGTNIMFGDIIIYDAQRQVALNLKQ